MQTAEPTTVLVVFMSVLFPLKLWYAPDQPMTIDVRPNEPVTLVMTNFGGTVQDPQATADIETPRQVDLKQIFPQMRTPGAYVLYAVPRGQSLPQFVGTPLIIQSRADDRRDAAPGPVVYRVEPARYAVLHTDEGAMTIAFYLGSAPNTSNAFLTLAAEGYYDGLTFHRLVPGFVLQGGDPRGDGSGGPGYALGAEFNARPHRKGVLSMARVGDPMEREGAMPRAQFANSAGSQFFLVLDDERARQLDRRYTVFGRVVRGLDVLDRLAATPVGGPENQTPQKTLNIRRVEVRPVTADSNPYVELLQSVEADAAAGAAR